jgi:hypothetical protein
MVDADGNVWSPQVVSRHYSDMRMTTIPAVIVGSTITAAQVNHRIGRLKRREPASVY